MELKATDKIQLLFQKCYDLRNADYKQLYDLAILDMLAEDDNDFKVNSKEIISMVINARNKSFCNDDIYILDKGTISKLVLEIQQKLTEIELRTRTKASEECLKRFSEMGICDSETKEALNYRISILEERVHTLKLAKTIILPTCDMYKSKKEYDALRAHLGEAIRKNKKLDEKNRLIKVKNSVLQRELDELKAVLKENGVLYADELK